MKHILTIISFVLIALGIVTAIIFFIGLSREYTYNGRGPILIDKSGEVGDFIGGVIGTIFSLAGFFMLFLTLVDQGKSFRLERFESKFFELIKLHRDNIDEISINMFKSGGRGKVKVFRGRNCFRYILEEFGYCQSEIAPFFEGVQIDDIYVETFYNRLIDKLNGEGRRIDFIELARINVAYCIVFFGVGVDSSVLLEKYFDKKYHLGFVRSIIEYARMKPRMDQPCFKNWFEINERFNFKRKLEIFEEIRELRKEEELYYDFENESEAFEFYYESKFDKYYGGRQHNLGHYFRHLFQTVKYVSRHKDINSADKYFYIKTLRGQTSSYEQLLLFINSLSFLGMAWELYPEMGNSSKKKDMVANKLITSYNLIKNLPGEGAFGFYYRNYYPDVEYEWDSAFK